MFTLKFWKDSGERAIRTAAQALLALWAVDISGFLELDPLQAASVAGFAAVTSILTSLVASGKGDKGTPAFVSQGN
jgi:hypothetical protein